MPLTCWQLEGEDLRPLPKVIAAMQQLGATHVTMFTRLDMAPGCIRNRLRLKREMGTAPPSLSPAKVLKKRRPNSHTLNLLLSLPSQHGPVCPEKNVPPTTREETTCEIS